MFAKAFAPDVVASGGKSTLAFTIDNSASALAAAGLAFTDSLPAGMVVAAAANESSTCSGGTLTAVPGTALIGYTGGSVAAGASCSLQVDVSASAPGAYVNTTGDLTSSSGNSATASSSLEVSEKPAVPVPTMNKWGLLVLFLSTVALGLWFVWGPRRRDRRVF